MHIYLEYLSIYLSIYIYIYIYIHTHTHTHTYIHTNVKIIDFCKIYSFMINKKFILKSYSFSPIYQKFIKNLDHGRYTFTFRYYISGMLQLH